MKNDDIRILRDIEQFYSTQIDEMPMNVCSSTYSFVRCIPHCCVEWGSPRCAQLQSHHREQFHEAQSILTARRGGPTLLAGRRKVADLI